MFPIVEPRQRPERFLLNRFSPLAESAAFLGLGGFDGAGSVWYPDARRLLGAVPNDGTLINMDPATAWSRDLGRAVLDFDGSNDCVALAATPSLSIAGPYTWSAWIKYDQLRDYEMLWSRSTTNAEDWSIYNGSGRTTVVHNRNNGGTFGYTQAISPSIATWTRMTVVWIGSGTTPAIYYGDNAQSPAGSGGSFAALLSSGYSSYLGATTNTTTYGATNEMDGMIADPCIWSRAVSIREIAALADPSNVMLEVGGVPLILPPRRVAFPAAVAEPVLTYRNYILGGGVF